MVTQKHNIELNISLPGYEHTVGLGMYPVDLSLFQNVPQVYSVSSNHSCASSQERCDLVASIQFALACWNKYVASGEERPLSAFLEVALTLVEQAQCLEGDAKGWPLAYSHPLYFTHGHWLSSVAQGCGLSVLTRAYQLTCDQRFLETAHCIGRTFERDILDGGICTPIGADGIFFEEVAVYPASHTLQGCIFALLGLYDYAAISDNSYIPLIQCAETTLHKVFDEFDLGFWTRADLLQNSLATPTQLAQQIVLLKALATYTGCQQCIELASHWQYYQQGWFSRLRYTFAHRKTQLKQALVRWARKFIISGSFKINQQTSPLLHICVCVSDYPSLGGLRTFLNRTSRIMADRWQMEYVTQRIRPGAEERVIYQFGSNWMTPWHFPQVWFYVLAGICKLLSLMKHSMNYGLLIPQDGVFSGAFAAIVGRLVGVRVVCFDHSTLTWYKSRAYHTEAQRRLDGKEWPRLFRQLVQFLRAFYWPSLRILAKLTMTQASHLLIPGVAGDEIDEICRELHFPISRVTRFNVTVDETRYVELSNEERVSRRVSMNIPPDALVIAITVRLELEKGLDVSIESIAQTVHSLPSILRDRVRVMIAGDGMLRGLLEEEIRSKGLSQICKVMGHISSTEISSLLEVSDISLHTSTRGVCMPAAVLEGMAAGCAVIASTEPLANVRVLSEGRGIVVPAGDVEQTSKALESLIKDGDLRDRLGKAARSYITMHHSPEAFRRVLLRASYWSDLDQLLEIQAEPPEANMRMEQE